MIQTLFKKFFHKHSKFVQFVLAHKRMSGAIVIIFAVLVLRGIVGGSAGVNTELRERTASVVLIDLATLREEQAQIEIRSPEIPRCPRLCAHAYIKRG